MTLRPIPCPVVQHKAQVKGIARTPDTTFAIDETFDSALYHFPVHIEGTQRKARPGIDPQVGTLFSVRSYQVEGPVFFQGKREMAFAIRLSGSEFLILVIIGFHLDSP